jgi:3-isopropylmalate dehydratase small subunit
MEDGLQQPLMKRGIDTDCAVIPLLCLQSIQSTEFLKKVKKCLKSNSKDIFIDHC